MKQKERVTYDEDIPHHDNSLTSDRSIDFTFCLELQPPNRAALFFAPRDLDGFASRRGAAACSSLIGGQRPDEILFSLRAAVVVARQDAMYMKEIISRSQLRIAALRQAFFTFSMVARR